MTKKQMSALNRLEKALESVAKSGLTLMAMDDDLYAVTNNCVSDYEKIGLPLNYSLAADALRKDMNENEGSNSYTIKQTSFGGSGGW